MFINFPPVQDVIVQGMEQIRLPMGEVVAWLTEKTAF